MPTLINLGHKSMNFSIFINPLLSLLCFYTIFFYPQVAVILLFFSPYFLLSYLENMERSKKTDIISLGIFLIGAIFLSLPSLYYLLFVIIPIFILIFIRDRMTTQSYLAPLLAPLPVFIIISLLLIFSSSFQEVIRNAILEFINTITAPFENTVEKFSNLGVLSYLMADKEKATNYIIHILPAMTYVVISIVVFVTDRLTSLKNETENTYIERDYRLPDKFVWFLILGGFLILIPIENIKFVSINILMICGVLYFFQGIQMISILFDRLKIGGIFRGFIYAFLCTEPPVMAILSLLGLFSIWFRPKWSIREINTEK